MSTPEPSKNEGIKLVDSLLSIKNDRFEVWKYFEDRADRLGERLWLTGTWLMSLLAATLSLPFVAKLISFPDTGFPIQVPSRIPVVLIALFGILFCLYSYSALHDLRDHIQSNWRRAAYALTGKSEPTTWGGRKQHGWTVLLLVGILAIGGFTFLLLIACLL